MNTVTRRTLVLIAMIAALIPLGAAAKDAITVPGGVTLIVFRHVDRTGSEENLNATGVARAAALPAALEGVTINAIYGPEIKRNRDTVLPLAAERELDFQPVATYSMPDILAKTLAGETVVWVGNKGNLKRLWLRILAPGLPPLNYGELFTVKFINDVPPLVTRSYFGE